MPSVRKLLIESERTLSEAGVDTPSLDSQLLLARVLGTTRSNLLASLTEDVPEAAEREYRELVLRRARREPMAYILGFKEFWGREFKITPDVLIPRPETEILLEMALERADRVGGVVLDVGTGSGCLAISLALELPGREVYAVDSSAKALKVAGENAARLQAGANLRLLEGDLLDPVQERAGLVLANLPYVPSSELERLQPEIRRWEPAAALDGGVDGFDYIKSLVRQLPRKCLNQAICLLEIDPRQYQAIEREVAYWLPEWRVRGWPDLSGRTRVAEIFRSL